MSLLNSVYLKLQGYFRYICSTVQIVKINKFTEHLILVCIVSKKSTVLPNIMYFFVLIHDRYRNTVLIINEQSIKHII